MLRPATAAVPPRCAAREQTQQGGTWHSRLLHSWQHEHLVVVGYLAAPRGKEQRSDARDALTALLLPDTRGHESAATLRTRASTNAGPRVAEGTGRANRQTRASVLAGSLLAVGSMQNAPTEYAALSVPRTFGGLDAASRRLRSFPFG